MSVVAFLRDQPSASSKKASDGWYIEIELVIAARNSMKNQTAPIDVAEGAHVGEDHRQGVEAEAEGAALRPRAVMPASAEEDERGGERDQAAEADLEELVGGRGGEARRARRRPSSSCRRRS